jgi:hypothetical protein
VWREYAEIYGILLDPATEPIRRSPPARVREHLRPRDLPARHERLPGPPARRSRRTSSSAPWSASSRCCCAARRRRRSHRPPDRAPLPRRREGPDELLQAFARITPSDERIRVA